MKRKTNIIFGVAAVVLMVALAGVGVVAAITSSFTISNKIIYKSTDVFYKVEANVYSMSEAVYENYADINALLQGEAGNEITATYVGNFDGKNGNNPNESEVWEIPDGDLHFTSTKRMLVYVFEIENSSTNDSVTVDIELPQSNSNITNTKSTATAPIILTKSGAAGSAGVIYVLCKCNSIENNFEVINNITITIDKVETSKA